MRILLSGMIAADPYQGGATWAVLQYLLGLRRLGHDVFFVESVQDKSLKPAAKPLEHTVNAAYFRQVMTDFGFADNAALLRAGTSETVGLSYSRLRESAGRADLLINIAGLLTDAELFGRIPTRVYLDLDPAFTQLWHAVQGIDMRFDGHTQFVTIGCAIGQAGCTVPTCEQNWITTLQPIVLEHWPVAGKPGRAALTTVGNWRGYGSIEYQRVLYGQKAHSLRPLFGLPKRTSEKFLLALAIHPEETKDLEALADNGWQIIDPTEVAGTPARYRQFIQGSKAELGIAKSGYVASRCGWFSDRSVCYLASGRPVLAQETGFSRFLPTGEGLFAFATAEDVLAALDTVNHDYQRHARAARALTEEFFDSDKVLPNLLERIGMAP
jgi:hypothetical protein